ncbi:hypothetical protein Enr13x_03090 [Stieleria neptunia]|uniref:Uncharacterized protein n=1 Tax=Stieleria neptunia TaxID=2527979 RepID=A0A518HI76_9BACT|nr:hypothetical protein [Stieleria neptunia]QDV40503.1 hypothetical protein Enr13x_03090 [Stieleria neptunia]
MSDFDQHPGGGFSSVDGYNDPAGSQAEEMRRMQQDELNRQQQEQAAWDAAAQAEAAQAEAAFSQPDFGNQGDARGRPNANTKQAKSAKTQSARAQPKSKPNPPTPQGPVSPGFAILGFVLAGSWGMGLLDGDGRWFGGLVTGLIGAYVAGHYHKVLIAACLVGGGWWFLSQYEPPNRRPTETVSTINTAPAVSPSRDVNEVVPTPKPQTAEQEVAALHPYPAIPALLLRPHQDLSTDPTRMRAFQNAMFDFEKKTGKSFLRDHRSMQPATRTRYDYFPSYSSGGLQEGSETIADLLPTQGVWDYRSPQLWELDLLATVDQHFLYKTTRSNGTIREGVFRTYSGDGLCYKPMTRPLLRRGDKHEGFHVPVRGGQVWRDFARSVYHAKTDAELLALDPFNLAIAHTHQKIAETRASHESQKRLIDGLRRAALPVARAAWNLRSDR